MTGDDIEECLPGLIEYVIRRSGGESALRFYGHIVVQAKDKLASVTVRRAVIYEIQGGNLMSGCARGGSTAINSPRSAWPRSS